MLIDRETLSSQHFAFVLTSFAFEVRHKLEAVVVSTLTLFRENLKKCVSWVNYKSSTFTNSKSSMEFSSFGKIGGILNVLVESAFVSFQRYIQKQKEPNIFCFPLLESLSTESRACSMK